MKGPSFCGLTLQGRRVKVRAQLVPRDTREALDLKHSFGRHTLPLGYGLGCHAKLAGQFDRASQFPFRGEECFAHGGIESMSFNFAQASLSVTDGQLKGRLSAMGMGARIKAVRDHFDLTQQGFADRLGVSRGAVGNWERELGVKFANLVHIAKEFGVSVDWLSTEKGPMFGFDDDTALASAVGEEDETPRVGNGTRVHLKPGTIPEFDLRAGMSYGGGYAIEAQVSDGDNTYSAEQVKAEWGIPAAFLQGELRLSPARTHVLAVDGPSMLPDLMPGDRVLIDLTHVDPRQGGIFAVREDGGVIIKHVEIVRGSDPLRIICKSSNPTYSPFELILDGEKVAIIGRVAGKISRM